MSAKILILLSVFFCGVTSECMTSCFEFWTGYRGACYRLFQEEKNFEDAEAYCRQFELHPCSRSRESMEATGHLASIHSHAVNSFLIGLVDSSLPKMTTPMWNPPVYIGMKVGNTKSHTTWTDMSPVDYDGWYTGKPKNTNSRGVIARGNASRGLWEDVSPSNEFRFICMLPSHICWDG